MAITKSPNFLHLTPGRSTPSARGLKRSGSSSYSDVPVELPTKLELSVGEIHCGLMSWRYLIPALLRIRRVDAKRKQRLKIKQISPGYSISDKKTDLFVGLFLH
jgi:hypothetical protein